MNYKRQQGMSLLGWIIVLIVAGIFASVGIKLVPHYMNNKTLEKLITSVEREKATGVQVRNPAELYAHIEKGMGVNNIRDLRARDIMEVRADGGMLHVHVNYEVREKFLKNIDLVVSFDKEYRVRNQ